MADGELTTKLELTLDLPDLERLQVAAKAAGVSVEAYARDLLVDRLPEDRWSVSRRRLADYERTGVSISVEEAMAHFDREVETRLGKPPR